MKGIGFLLSPPVAFLFFLGTAFALYALTATKEEATEFGRLWQGRVRLILIDHFDDPELVVLQ